MDFFILIDICIGIILRVLFRELAVLKRGKPANSLIKIRIFAGWAGAVCEKSSYLSVFVLK